MVTIRDLIDILILMINNLITLIKIYLIIISINCVIDVFIKVIYN